MHDDDDVRQCVNIIFCSNEPFFLFHITGQEQSLSYVVAHIKASMLQETSHFYSE